MIAIKYGYIKTQKSDCCICLQDNFNKSKQLEQQMIMNRKCTPKMFESISRINFVSVS